MKSKINVKLICLIFNGTQKVDTYMGETHGNFPYYFLTTAISVNTWRMRTLLLSRDKILLMAKFGTILQITAFNEGTKNKEYCEKQGSSLK